MRGAVAASRPAGTNPNEVKKDMNKLIAAGALALALTAAAPAGAQATPVVDVPCYNGSPEMAWKVKPKRCAFNGDEAHAYQTPIVEMTWRTWGGSTACGRGVFVYNSGYRARVRLCLYAVRWVDGAPTYTKIRGRFGTRASALDMDGNRVSFTRKPSRFKNSTW